MDNLFPIQVKEHLDPSLPGPLKTPAPIPMVCGMQSRWYSYIPKTSETKITFVGQRANMFSLKLDELKGLQANNQCFYKLYQHDEKERTQAEKGSLWTDDAKPVKEAFADSVVIDATQGHQMCQ